MSPAARKVIAGFSLVFALNTSSIGDSVKLALGDAVSLPPQTQMKDSNNPRPDCTRPNSNIHCKPLPPPDYRPYPHRPRPVIINQLPAQPAVEVNSLTDDWEGCRKAKLGSIRARNSGSADEANNLDEWLWKNCRSYSYELRQLEQDDM